MRSNNLDTTKKQLEQNAAKTQGYKNTVQTHVRIPTVVRHDHHDRHKKTRLARGTPGKKKAREKDKCNHK